MWTRIALFVALTVCAIAAISGEGDPRNRLVVDKLTKGLETEGIAKTELTFTPKGDEIILSGRAEQMVDLDDNWRVNIVIFRSKEANGNFTKFFALPERGVCEVMKTYYKSYFYESLKPYSNAPSPEICPVVKDTYTLKDYPVDSTKFKKFLMPGFYRFVATLKKDNELKLEYTFEGHVVELDD